MQFTSLFLYKPVFAIQLLVIELIFTSRLPRRKHFVWRLLAGVLVTVGIAFLFPTGEYSYNALYGSFMFLFIFAVSVGAMFFMFEDKFSNVFFCALAGYTVQHISQETYEIITLIMNPSGEGILNFYGSGEIDFQTLAENWMSVMLYVLIYLVLFAVFYWVAYFFFASRIGKYDILSFGTVTALATFILVVDIVVSSVITYMVPRDGNFAALFLLHLYNVACCVLAIILLFELPRRKRLENEYAVTRSLLQRSVEKYNETKETVNLINIKCHDMKHQIRRFAEKGGIADGEVAEIENLINIYDADYQTSNEAFNIIMMEKSLLCRKQNITLSCIADGAPLSFIADADIYSLFGNLLDNSIEAVMRLKEDRRSIGVYVRAVNKFLLINVYNDYVGQIKFENGLPVTTKSDKSAHGFGFKSIRHVVDQYGGELTVSSDNGIFDVSIVIPMPEK